MEILKYQNGYICITHLSENAVRIRTGLKEHFTEQNPCVRYGIYDMTEKPVGKNHINVAVEQGQLSINDIKTDIVFGNGFEFNMTVGDKERFYGLGDADRSTLERGEPSMSYGFKM